MPPAQLLEQRLRQALTATHPVLEPGSGLATVELRAELDEFDQVFSAPTASEGVVRLRVTATAPLARQGRLLGQRSFVQRVPAPTPDAEGGAQALREASDALVREVAAWVGALPAPQ
jgi:cholesterol transport system auxiliary component